MINREFSSLAPRISPNTPGCPQPLIIQAVRNAAIRTCERTLGWRHAEPPYELQPGVHEYLYRKPAGSDVHAVFGASINGYSLNHLPLDAALQQYPSSVSYTHLRAHETKAKLVCRLLLELL